MVAHVFCNKVKTMDTKYLMFYFYMLFLFFISFADAQAGWKTDRESLDHVYVFNGFRLFYTLKGKHALYDVSDKDRSGIPDIVENTAIQLDVANSLFSGMFQFIKPANNMRYYNKLGVIDVHFLFSNSKGSSGDALITYNYKKVKVRKLLSLSILISTKIKTGNLTPAHELFHAYQNGYTMFKNRWYTEGTARWVEHAFNKSTGQQKLLPATEKKFEKLLNATYDAEYFWNRIVFLCSRNPIQYKLTPKLKQSRYISSLERVIQANEFNGYRFILSFFQQLSQIDERVSMQRGLDRYHWKESEQRSIKNNRFILIALKKTLNQTKCDDNLEVNQFLKLVDHYVNSSVTETFP
jgi:hypothetical protein